MSSPEKLSDKSLVMLVGPSAIGKSAVMEEITRQDAKFAYVRSFTTRKPRPNEVSHYRFITSRDADEKYQSGDFVTFSQHPTTGKIYGTDLESYPSEHNLLDTLSGNVKDFRKEGLKATTTLGIAAPPEDWRTWFTNRYPEPSDEAQKRLDEARLSINWALGDAETHWLVNREGTLTQVAKKAISIVTMPPDNQSIPDEPYAMLELLDKGMWR